MSPVVNYNGNIVVRAPGVKIFGPNLGHLGCRRGLSESPKLAILKPLWPPTVLRATCRTGDTLNLKTLSTELLQTHCSWFKLHLAHLLLSGPLNVA